MPLEVQCPDRQIDIPRGRQGASSVHDEPGSGYDSWLSGISYHIFVSFWINTTSIRVLLYRHFHGRKYADIGTAMQSFFGQTRSDIVMRGGRVTWEALFVDILSAEIMGWRLL